MPRVELFGPLTIVGARGSITGGAFPSRKARQVVALLALARGRPVAKERIIDQLWSERLPLDPGGALEQAVSVLRRAVRAIDDADLVVTRRGVYSLAPGVEIDVLDFERALGAAREATDLARRADGLERAVAVGREPLLADEPEAPLAVYDRRRFQLDVDRAALELAETRLALDDADGALGAARFAQSRAPGAYDEAYRVELAALARLGLGHEAHARLAEFEQRLVTEQRSARIDLEVVRALVERSPRVVPGHPPVMVGLDWRSRVGGQPAELPVAGRRAELAAVLTGGHVAVHGASGSGRSRFLDEVAAGIGERTVVRLACLAAEATEPLLTANRLLRVVGRTAGVTVRHEADADGCVSRAMRLVGRLGAVTLLLDDLDLADDATVAVIASLAAEAHDVADLRVVATMRTTAAVRPALRPLAREVELRCLTTDEVGELQLAVPVDDVIAATGGHPATVHACVAAGTGDGVLGDDALQRVTTRFLALDAAARSAISALAGVGGAATHAALASAARLASGQLGAILADALDAELVEFAGDMVRIRGSVVTAAIAAMA